MKHTAYAVPLSVLVRLTVGVKWSSALVGVCGPRRYVSDIIPEPEQELLPDDVSKRWQIEASVEKQRLAFGRLMETILGKRETAERVMQARGGRLG